MIDCDNFITFMVDEEVDLEEAVVEARDRHARTCDECGRLLDGYRAYVACRQAERAGLRPREDRVDRVKEAVLRAAREAIAERQREHDVRKPTRNRALALAAAAAVLLAAGVEIWRLLPEEPPPGRGVDPGIIGIHTSSLNGGGHDHPKR